MRVRILSSHFEDKNSTDQSPAHHCNKKHPYSRIMKEFYWPAKMQDFPVPHILGLTASPVVRSDMSTLQKLESTLDAVCRSPTRHRDELLAHSNRPVLFNITYTTQSLYWPDYTEAVTKIHQARDFAKNNIMDDPYVKHLRTQSGPRARQKLEAAVMQHKTYVQKQLKALCKRSVDIAIEIGTWAAGWVCTGNIPSNAVNRLLTYLSISPRQ